MPDYRETIIRLDHEAKTAQIWSQNRAILTRARRSGFVEENRQGSGVWLSGPIRGILIRKGPSGARKSTNQGRPFAKRQPAKT